MIDQGKTEQLTDSLKKYLNTNLELIKLQTTERSSVIFSSLISRLFVGLAGVSFVFFLSLGMGFYLNTFFENFHTGFAIVAGFYFLLCLILILIRKKFVEAPIRDKIIRTVLNKN